MMRWSYVHQDQDNKYGERDWDFASGMLTNCRTKFCPGQTDDVAVITTHQLFVLCNLSNHFLNVRSPIGLLLKFHLNYTEAAWLMNQFWNNTELIRRLDRIRHLNDNICSLVFDPDLPKNNLGWITKWTNIHTDLSRFKWHYGMKCKSIQFLLQIRKFVVWHTLCNLISGFNLQYGL